MICKKGYGLFQTVPLFLFLSHVPLILYKAVLGKKDSVVTKLHPEIPKTLEPAAVS